MPIVSAFRRASRLLSPDDLEAVKVLLHSWQRDGIGRTVAPNLRDREFFLRRRCMAALLGAVIRGNPAPEEVADQYQQECYRHQLRGGRIRVSSLPRALGRAVDGELFALYLWQTFPERFAKIELARDFVTMLTLDEIDEEYKELTMSQYTAWATWKEDDPSADPFDFVHHHVAAEVQAALGMDERLFGVLLLLRFWRPDDLPLFRPTVADAGLFPHFDPPQSTEKAHSRTRPWPNFLIRGDPMEWGRANSHPEAVHGPVKLRWLSQTVEALP